MKAISILLASAVFAIAAPLCAQQDRLEVAYSTIGGSSIPLRIAQEKGFFGRNGIDTRQIYIGGGRSVAQSIAAGQIHIALITSLARSSTERCSKQPTRALCGRAHRYHSEFLVN